MTLNRFSDFCINANVGVTQNIIFQNKKLFIYPILKINKIKLHSRIVQSLLDQRRKHTTELLMIRLVAERSLVLVGARELLQRRDFARLLLYIALTNVANLRR